MIRHRSRLYECARRWRRVQTRQQSVQRAEIEIAVAPLQHLHRVIAVVLDLLHQLAVEGFAVPGHAERAVIHIAAGAAGNLADLFGLQQPHRHAVELFARGEGDVIDIHIDAHADRVGGDHEIDFARLIEFHLGVACSRAERAHDDGRTAALTANRVGEAVNILHRESDDGGAAGQAGQLLGTRIGEVGKPRPRDEMRLRRDTRDGASHGSRAEPHRFFFAARVDQPVGEDVAAFGIGAELNFVDGEESDRDVHRHRFDRAHIETREFRDDAFFAGDQGDIGGTLQANNLVEHLARQKPQRQTDHAGAVRQHARNGKMRLAGIRGPKDRRDSTTEGCRFGASKGLPGTPISHRLYLLGRNLPVFVSCMQAVTQTYASSQTRNAKLQKVPDAICGWK